VLETKYKAAEAYARRVTRRVDPGLAEVDYSDRFETRIYPIMPHGSRTIRLKMVSQFDPSEGYALPLALNGKVGKFNIDVSGDARIVAGPKDGENIALTAPLKLAAAERGDAMLVSEHPGAERFFDLVLSAPQARASSASQLHIFWDRSVSRTDDSLKAEAKLAEDYANARKLRTVKVTMFDSGAVETRDIAVDRLTEELGRVRYRGATSYATLKGIDISSSADCLMFSDGRVTIDDRRDFGLPCRISAVTSGPESDRAWLSEITSRSSGTMIDLASVKADAALTQLQKPVSGIVSVTDAQGERIDIVKLAAGAGSLHIVGPLPDNGPVLVRLAGEASPRSFAPPQRMSSIFAGPGAIWARQRLGVAAADLPPDELAKMARRYNVATPQASFVVLETPNDYVQSDIEPPTTYPKALQQQYVSLRKNADQADERAQASRLDRVASIWQGQKDWWSQKFTGKKRQELAREDSGQVVVTANRAETESRARPAAPPPPPAMRAAPSGAARDGDTVVVTGNLINRAPQDAARPVEVFTSEDLRAQGAPNVQEFARSLSTSGGDEREAEEAEKKGGKTIEVAAWNADRPYLKRLDKAGKEWEAAIDKEDAATRALPLFWFDVAEWHWRAGRKLEAQRAAEAALDLPSRDNQTLAIVAARLLRYGAQDRAIWLLERLAEREADRPQPSRTLALALLERAKTAKTEAAARADTERAVELLYKASTQLFDVQATGVEEVTLMEANAAAAKLKRMGGSSRVINEKLADLLDADVRVVMEWNTPRTDLDLWITEPNGEKVGYSTPASSWGGKLSGDVTNGYGPEEYLIRTARPGVYEIRANTFASDRNNPNGPSSLTVRIYRNFGRPSQTEELIDVEMDAEDRDQRLIGKVTIK
jgi:hypothetical protein